jgi:hypothetical protein
VPLTAVSGGCGFLLGYAGLTLCDALIKRAEGNPITSTIRAVLEDMKDDDDLVHAMRECLV